MPAIANLPALPSPDTPFLLQNGKINPVWFRYLTALDRALRAAS